MTTSEGERTRSSALTGDVATLWSDPGTTAANRKQVVRLLVDRVVVHVRPDSERVEVTISWLGGSTTGHEIVR